ncbi:MAG TPA: serine hydrolase domain-containing protein [Acidimicrobiales bacterium]|nr:serine hydrolase domain-containing protein [Acidimicrobiales bacterium]
MSALGALFDRARREVDDRLPSCQLALAAEGELVGFETFGDATNDTRYLLWSCTKAVVAGVVWQLMGEGLIDVERTVASYLPEFATNGKDVVTVEQVLLHTAGFPLAPMSPIRWGTSDGRREAFSRWRLTWEPGTRFEYHPLAAWWVLAELIVEVTGNDYRDEVRRRIAEPLGLHSLQLGVPEDEQGDIAELSVVGERATEAEYRNAGVFSASPPARGNTSPPARGNTSPLGVEVTPSLILSLGVPAAKAVGIPGGGAVATAADLALYYQALLHNPGGLWSDDVLVDVTGVIRNTFPDVPKWGMPANRSRGVVVRGDHDLAHWMMHFGPGTSPGTFGHDGAGGMIAWADPQSGLSFCFLTNGMDANAVHEAIRCQDLARLAAACGSE